MVTRTTQPSRAQRMHSHMNINTCLFFQEVCICRHVGVQCTPQQNWVFCIHQHTCTGYAHKGGILKTKYNYKAMQHHTTQQTLCRLQRPSNTTCMSRGTAYKDLLPTTFCQAWCAPHPLLSSQPAHHTTQPSLFGSIPQGNRLPITPPTPHP